MVPVLKDNSVIGVVTEGNMTSALLSGRAEPDASVADAKVIYKTFRKIGLNDRLADLAQALDFEPYALIITEQRCYAGKRRKLSEASEDSAGQQVETRSVVSGIVTRIDLLDYVSSGGSNNINANSNENDGNTNAGMSPN